MSSHRRRHRLRHIANPHCWFRRPTDGPHQDALPYGAPLLSAGETPVWGLPLAPSSAHGDGEDREREEEEYNMALALSLSTKEQSRSVDLETQEAAQLARAKQDSMAPSTSSGAAESLSWSLFTNNCLEWEDTVCDGLYDVWGQFPEIVEIAPESGITKLFPSLAELQKIPFTPGDSREVVVVDHSTDDGLCVVDERAAEAVSQAIKQGAEACAQALAVVVVESMGGPSSAGELAQRCWDHMQQLKFRKGSLVLKIGEVKVGLARHRALLFKSLADACRLPCKVVRGEHLGEGTTGDRAAVMVRLQDRLFSVDLFSASLRLIGNKTGQASQTVSARQSAADAAGLEWNGDLDGPSLVPVSEASERSASSPHGVSSGQLAERLQRMSTEDLQQRAGSHAHASSSGTVAEPQQRRAPLNSTAGNSAASSSSQLLRQPSDYPPIIYSESEQVLSAPRPYPAGAPPGSSLPATSSLAERMARNVGRSPAVDSRAEASQRDTGNSADPHPGMSPFMNADFQSRESGEEPEGLGGSFEFIDGRVTETTPPASAKGPTAVAAGVPDFFPGALSPFADPSVQDSEVPYGNLPVDKGHLVPLMRSSLAERRVRAAPQPQPIVSCPAGSAPQSQGTARSNLSLGADTPSGALKRAPSEDDESEQESQAHGGSAPVSGTPARLETEAAEPPERVNDDKAHWKLRALANIRRHSDSDIFIDSGRRSNRERLVSRLEALPELVESPAHEGNRPDSTDQVPPAKPLAAVSHVASGDSSASSIELPEEWEIRPEDLKLGPRVGIGSYGEVYRGIWRYTDVAVKRLIDQELSGSLMEEFKAEIGIMKRLRHVNVLLFLGAVTSPPNLAIVTQFMPRGSLFRLMHRTPSLVLDEKRRLRMAIDIARGMNYLHSCIPPIVHRDLKSPNLLVDKDFTVKVCDFGLSRVRLSTVLSGKSQAGTPEWTAPEVLRSQAYDESSDCYSYGVILWELLTNEEPWHDKTAMQVVGAVGWGNARLQIPVGTHPALASLITRCWSEPKARPTFADVLQYFKALQEDIFVRPPKAEGDAMSSASSGSIAERVAESRA